MEFSFAVIIRLFVFSRGFIFLYKSEFGRGDNVYLFVLAFFSGDRLRSELLDGLSNFLERKGFWGGLEIL